MTILVIEDSRFLRLALERILVKAGYHVIAVGDGQEGLLRAQDNRPDLILLDMMLPTLEGTEVLRQLKQDPLTTHIPIIVLSGLSQKNEEKLKTAGAVAYFEKSLLNLDKDGSSLVQAVQNVVDELRGVEDTPRLPAGGWVSI
jgi:CheY-like chemotaxis protein